MARCRAVGSFSRRSGRGAGGLGAECIGSHRRQRRHPRQRHMALLVPGRPAAGAGQLDAHRGCCGLPAACVLQASRCRGPPRPTAGSWVRSTGLPRSGNAQSVEFTPPCKAHGSNARWPAKACGEVAEWSIAPHSKCGILARVSGVRISPSPPIPSLHIQSVSPETTASTVVFSLCFAGYSRRCNPFRPCHASIENQPAL